LSTTEEPGVEEILKRMAGEIEDKTKMLESYLESRGKKDQEAEQLLAALSGVQSSASDLAQKWGTLSSMIEKVVEKPTASSSTKAS